MPQADDKSETWTWLSFCCALIRSVPICKAEKSWGGSTCLDGNLEVKSDATTRFLQGQAPDPLWRGDLVGMQLPLAGRRTRSNPKTRSRS